MSTDMMTYLNYMATWDGESEQHIDAVITEYNLFLLCENIQYEKAVNEIFDPIKDECISVRDLTISADATQIAADAAAIASIWSFGMGMAAYAALEAAELIERKVISSKASELNDMLTHADTNIATKIGGSVPNFVSAYKGNNDLIAASSPKGLDTRTCRSYLYQFLTKLKYKFGKDLNVKNFKTYAESARKLYDSQEINQIYDALDNYNLSDRTDKDLEDFLKVLAGYDYPSPIAQEIVYNVSFGILLYKMKVAGDKMKTMAEEAGCPVEELETSRFAEMDIAGKLVAGIVVIMSVIDIVYSILNIVDVVKQCEKQCEEIDTIRESYKSYYKSISVSSAKMNKLLQGIIDNDDENEEFPAFVAIKSVSSGRYLDGRGGESDPLMTDPYLTWSIIQVDGNYAIRSLSSGRYLDGRGGESDPLMTDRPPQGDSYLQWTIVNVDGNVSFRSVSSGRYLDGRGGESNPLMTDRPPQGDSYLQWTIEHYEVKVALRSVSSGRYWMEEEVNLIL